MMQDIWIAPLLKEGKDNFDNPVNEYGEPYKISGVKLNSLNGSVEFYEFGEKIKHMAKALLPMYAYHGVINEKDKAYLYGTNPNDEEIYGSKANYRIDTVRPQGVKLLVYFERIK